MAVIQLDFLKSIEESKFDYLEMEISKIKISTDRVRKGIYARHGEIAKRQLDLEERLSILERNICKSTNLLPESNELVKT